MGQEEALAEGPVDALSEHLLETSKKPRFAQSPDIALIRRPERGPACACELKIRLPGSMRFRLTGGECRCVTAAPIPHDLLSRAAFPCIANGGEIPGFGRFGSGWQIFHALFPNKGVSVSHDMELRAVQGPLNIRRPEGLCRGFFGGEEAVV